MSPLTIRFLTAFGLIWVSRGSEDVPPSNITENCPRECFCSKTLTSVNCAGKGLTSLPSGIPTKVAKLYLDHNKLTTIESYSFKELTSLVYLDLKSNKISSLKEHAFTGASALNTLFLSSNMITDVDTEAFEGLTNLQNLNLGANKLQAMIDLGYVPNLQQLVFQSNCLLDIVFPVEAENLKSLYDITLTLNQITNITSFAFLALKNARVRRLDLARNQISHIDTDAFVPLTQLQSMKLGFNPLSSQALIDAFTGIRSTVLQSLDISGVALNGALAASMFKPFQSVNLRNLKLNQNTIHELVGDNFQHLGHLLTLDLTACKLQTISSKAFNGLKQLTQLQLQQNLLNEVPQNLPKSLQKLYLDKNHITMLRKSDFDDLRGLLELHITYNSIVTLETETFFGLTSLRKLYLTGNKIATLPGDVFKPLQRLISLELNRNNIQQIPNKGDVFSVMSSLNYLNLAENFCKTVPLDLFTGMTELLYLHLENNFLGSVIESDISGNLFRGLPKLQELYLGNNDIRQLPESIFRSLASAHIIKLQDNKIFQWRENMFAITKNLEILDLSNNLIANFNKTSLKDLMKLKNLNLTGNPFSCDCDMRWFRDWLSRTKVQIAMVEAYKCNSPPSWQGKALLSFNSTLIDCTNKMPYYLGGGLGVGCLFTVVFVLVTYRYRWFLKLRVHRAGVGLKALVKKDGYQELRGDNNGFHGYISYSEADKQWVMDYLLPKFDNGGRFEGHFKLCFDDRDFIPGEADVGNIDTCMRSSRKILVVLSRKYIRDSKCEFELKHAFHIVNIEQEAEELILIKKGRLRMKDIPRVVHPMMENREFVEWPEDDEEGQEGFDLKLTEALNRRRPQNNLEI